MPRKASNSPDIQMTLDFGQKEFGSKLCRDCGMVYAVADLEDVKAHTSYHKKIFSPTITISRWKNQRVLQEFFDGSRIVEILQTDKRNGMVVFRQLSTRMNQDLGYDRPVFSQQGILSGKAADVGQVPPDWRIFVYVDSAARQAVGCCVTEDVSAKSAATKGYTLRRLTRGRQSLLSWRLQADSEAVYSPRTPLPKVDVSPTNHKQVQLDATVTSVTHFSPPLPLSSEALREVVRDGEFGLVFPVCGVRRLWVTRSHRRRGVATALLDCVIQNFALGCHLPRDRVAFAEPTADGANFAAAFTRREDFGIY